MGMLFPEMGTGSRSVPERRPYTLIGKAISGYVQTGLTGNGVRETGETDESNEPTKP